ncbi:6,7-dimethyl-8-ribityllumazine synthase [Roseiconus lacunae]|uniref:6,7-dimethyl-8-ribityllumazine synthase n=1 Tax=Roseiconus lacunae TaxID=2605694 RepID=A0ABT7PE69_9BACT|nr:6,7-dimethyl-8-ribityllumazine synthase [Roseiconus lacunae]MDM4014789.1 6,7-dimethyl-8-ribityllumazine synthase [Roseiconus lacunae]WRQ50378.1 6,7-dimethyl-8-ribityllumazine synthase [Stieleria sp. HD01]
MSTEVTGIEGQLPTGKIVIVASRYNESICDSLVQGSLKTLEEAGYGSDVVSVVRVPGAWELPLVCANALENTDVISAIVLGCVIKGETTHDEHINRSVSDAIMQLGLTTRKPIGFGLLTCNTLDQALQRSGGTVGNKGEEAAEAALELLRLGVKLSG